MSRAPVTSWERACVIIAQLSLSGFGAHSVATHQMEPTLGAIITSGIVVLGIVGRYGVAGGRVVVDGVRAWRRPGPPEDRSS